MPSRKPYIQIRTDEQTIAKFLKLASNECRSMSNLGEYIIKQYINRYEEEYGIIQLDEAKKLPSKKEN